MIRKKDRTLVPAPPDYIEGKLINLMKTSGPSVSLQLPSEQVSLTSREQTNSKTYSPSPGGGHIIKKSFSPSPRSITVEKAGDSKPFGTSLITSKTTSPQFDVDDSSYLSGNDDNKMSTGLFVGRGLSHSFDHISLSQKKEEKNNNTSETLNNVSQGKKIVVRTIYKRKDGTVVSSTTSTTTQAEFQQREKKK
jgi:hypothetical protein